MRVLFDQGTPVPLRRELHPHEVDTCAEMEWSTLQNGELLAKAEQASYEAFVATDRNLRYQQNLKGRNIRILFLSTTSWPRISKRTAEVLAALESLEVGGFIEVEI